MAASAIQGTMHYVAEDLMWFGERFDEWLSLQIESCFPWFAIWR